MERTKEPLMIGADTVANDLDVSKSKAYEIIRKLNQELREKNLRLFLRLRWGFLGQNMNLPGKGGRKISEVTYRIAQKFYGFN